MGLFGTGKRDTSTKEERDAWRERAEQQMQQQSDRNTSDNDNDQPPRHARRGLWS